MTGAVLHIDTGAQWRGGQQQVYLLHRELLLRGVGSRILARKNGALARRCLREGLPLDPVPGRSPWNPLVLWRLRRALGGAALVHAHDARAAVLGVAAKALRRETWLVCHRRVSYGLGQGRMSRWRYRRADAWVAVSAEIRTVLERAGVSGDRISVIHSAIDLDGFRSEASATDRAELRASLGIPAEASVVGFCGAFSPQKGHRVLLDAAPAILAERPDVVFLLPGEGELLAEARDWAARLGRSALLPGFRSDIAPLTSLFGVGVIPSVDGEGSSASIKEPMALGVPVVVSDLPGNVEVMGEGGLPFRNRDPQDLARAVVRLLSDDELRARLGERAARRVGRFSVRAMADATVGLYARLLTSRGVSEWDRIS
jgi:glycosyltransferase involved in cell wall biosynthesis